jgi:hypothetical protein
MSKSQPLAAQTAARRRCFARRKYKKACLLLRKETYLILPYGFLRVFESSRWMLVLFFA